MLLSKGSITVALLRLRHDLNVSSVNTDFVEAKIVSRSPDVVNPASHTDDTISKEFTLLKITEVLSKVPQIIT